MEMEARLGNQISTRGGKSQIIYSPMDKMPLAQCYPQAECSGSLRDLTLTNSQSAGWFVRNHREQTASAARSANIARISHRGELLLQPRAPQIVMAI